MRDQQLVENLNQHGDSGTRRSCQTTAALISLQLCLIGCAEADHLTVGEPRSPHTRLLTRASLHPSESSLNSRSNQQTAGKDRTGFLLDLIKLMLMLTLAAWNI